MFSNNTKNQHFVSRVEQKLNASNPDSASKRFKIHSFGIVDRETHHIKGTGRIATSSNLAISDLFSFDVPGGTRVRMNLEALFERYEKDIETLTTSLLQKLAEGNSNIKTEIIGLFAAKLLNFFRNPFCVQKVLNSLPGVWEYEPTNPTLLGVYRSVVGGRKPHQAHLCRELGISDEAYIKWLRSLFILLMLTGDKPTLFEEMIRGLFENRDTQPCAFIHVYDDDRCLLSDRGFCQPLPDGAHMAMSFNLCSTAFADYIFADAQTLVEGDASTAFVADALASWKRRPSVAVNVTVTKNDREVLSRYNRRVIEQSRESVYCSARTVWGASIVPPSGSGSDG